MSQGTDMTSYKGSGQLTREQFLFFEMRLTAKLVCEGMERGDIIERIIRENLFQFPTERMASSIANTCLKRIDALGSDVLTDCLANASLEVARQIVLYSMMKTNRIVWDFMLTVIAEKYRTQDFDYSKKDLNLFFFSLQEQNDIVAFWSDSTIVKMKQVLNRILVECGYLDSFKDTRLNAVTICPELEDEIRACGDVAALPAFNCFS